MANVTITIPDVLIPRITTAARALFPQYAALSDTATFKAITGDYWKNVLANYETNAADTAQRTQSLSDAAGIG